MSSPDRNSESTSRRDFLKTSALVGAGAALVVPAGFSSSLYASGDDTVKVGLIGCGGRGTGAAGQALITNGNVKLVAAGDMYQENAKSSVERIKKAIGEKANRVQVDLGIPVDK